MNIRPYHGVGALNFGDDRNTVRVAIAEEVTTFRKDVGEPETDAFDAVGLHVYYDASGRFEFLEAFGNAEIVIRGVRLLGRSVQAVENDMKRLGYDAVPGDAGPRFDGAGVVLTVVDSIVEGVGVFNRDYYNSNNPHQNPHPG